MVGKLIAAITLVVALLLGAFFAQKQYDKRYFEGGVQTYINAQQIPKNKIKNRTIYYSYKSSGWVEEFTLKTNKNYYYQYYAYDELCDKV